MKKFSCIAGSILGHGLIILTLGFILTGFNGCQSTESNDNRPENSMEEQTFVQFDGVLVFYGSEPRTVLCVQVLDSPRNPESTAESRQSTGQPIIYCIHPDFRTQLENLTGYRIRFSGYVQEDAHAFPGIQNQGIFTPTEFKVH